MYHCDNCSRGSLRRLRFVTCGHAICPGCVETLVWSDTDNHFLCCVDPTCFKCGAHTDVVAETDGGSSRTILEKAIEPDDSREDSITSRHSKR